MKPKQFLLVLLFMHIHIFIFPQKYTSARVTDFFNFVRTEYLLGFQDFTDYFSNSPVWSENLIGIADSLIRKKFKLQEVKFDLKAAEFKEVDEYAYGSMLHPPPVEGFKNVDRTDGELYIAIFSTFSASGSVTTNGIEQVYTNFLLKILVENKDEKTIYKKKVKIPFYLQSANYLDEAGLHHDDFKLIYEQALQAAFQGGGSFKKRPLRYSPLHFYDDFTAQCNYFYIKETDRYPGGNGTYEIFDRENLNVGVINLSGGGIHRELTEELLDLDLTNKLKQVGTLTNSLDSKPYEFIAGMSIPESYSHDINPNNPLVILKHGETEKGVFELNQNLVTGHFDKTNLLLKYIDPLDVYELFLNEKFAGVIQEGRSVKEGKKMRHYYNAFFLKTLSDQELTGLINLYMVYLIAYQIEAEFYREEED